MHFMRKRAERYFFWGAPPAWGACSVNLLSTAVNLDIRVLLFRSMLWALLFTCETSLDTPAISLSNFFSKLSRGLLLLADLSAAATEIVKAASDA